MQGDKIKASVGSAYGDDSYVVGANACQDAVQQLGHKDPDLLIVFSSVKYDQEKMLKGVRSVAPAGALLGSSTSGEITGQGPLKDKSVVVMAIKSEGIKYSVGVGENVIGDAQLAGKTVAEKVKKEIGDACKVFIMIPDALGGQGVGILKGVLESLGPYFPVVGGASGDDFLFKKTYQYANDKVYSSSVVGLGLSGAFQMGVGVGHGFVPIGESMKITKAKGVVVEEINGMPAIKAYESYFDEEDIKLLKTEVLSKLGITYPIGVKVEGSDELLIRHPMSVDENGFITYTVEIPEGSEVRLMIGGREEAIASGKQAAAHAKSSLSSSPKAAIIFNSISRNKLLGTHTEDEISAIQEVIGREVPLVGFYTYGEQAPFCNEVKDIGKCSSVFHNENVVIVLLGESTG